MTGSDVIGAAGEVERFCRGMNWKFCFIGGLVVQRWGVPRFTQDVDVSVLTGLGSEEFFIDAMLKHFSQRHADSRQFAIEQRVLLLRTHGGIDVDVALGAFPFEDMTIQHATPWQASDTLTLTTCSAEDLILHKAFASRDRDWGDIEGILTRQLHHLDLNYIRRELPTLLEIKDDVESFDKFERLITAIKKRMP